MKRIIFVDDEANIVDGLKRMFRTQRYDWDMYFATSGKDALAVLAQQPFDVIVSDMRMPGMDGAELLTQVKQLYPGSVRIILSGHSDLEASMRSVAVAHQVVAKPCEAEKLKRVVVRACSLEDFSALPQLRSELGRLKELPVLSPIYLELRTVLSQESVDIGRVAQLVAQDPGMALKVLQLVNSSFFGLCQVTADIRQATAYLGLKTIRDLVLGMGLFGQYEKELASSSFLVREHRHSMSTARIGRMLMQDSALVEETFLACMLHDVGRLVLAVCGETCISRIDAIESAETDSIGLSEIDRHGVSHAAIGAYLLSLWGMPDSVVEAVGLQHRPSSLSGQVAMGVVGATHIAACLAMEIDGVAPEETGLDMEYIDKLGLTENLSTWREKALESEKTERGAA